MQISPYIAICSPYWKAKQGFWLPFQPDKSLLSPEARVICTRLQETMPSHLSVYMRGSVIESLRPFPASDLDLTIVLPAGERLPMMPDAGYISHRELDVKILNSEKLYSEPVLYSLLAHRSIHVCGPILDLKPLKADFDFAWRQWLTCFPAGLPPQLTCNERLSVIFMKQMIRAFGVILFMQKKIYTRDLTACIRFSEEIHPDLPEQLLHLRREVEKKSNYIFNSGVIKKFLLDAFNQHHPSRIITCNEK